MEKKILEESDEMKISVCGRGQIHAIAHCKMQSVNLFLTGSGIEKCKMKEIPYRMWEASPDADGQGPRTKTLVRGRQETFPTGCG